MSTRLELHEIFCDLLGSRNVYFQPPESVKMRYPAIVYSRDDVDSKHANNNPYMQTTAYQVIVIDEDPDSEIVDKVKRLPMSTFDRHYSSDNLNHDTFTLYY